MRGASLLVVAMVASVGCGRLSFETALRDTATADFAVVKPVELEIDSTASLSDPAISADGHHLYVTVDRGGDLQLYAAARCAP